MGSVSAHAFDMGSICSIIAREKKKATAPHTLGELLSTVQLEDDISLDGLVKETRNNVWIARFLEYIRNRKLAEEEVALKFLIMTQPLQIQYVKRGTYGAGAAEKRRLFKGVCDVFLREENEEVLSLDNEALFNDLVATHAAVEAGLQVSEEALNELLRARRDLLVWEEGLEPVYVSFAQQMPLSQVACLLSLL